MHMPKIELACLSKFGVHRTEKSLTKDPPSMQNTNIVLVTVPHGSVQMIALATPSLAKPKTFLEPYRCPSKCCGNYKYKANVLASAQGHG